MPNAHGIVQEAHASKSVHPIRNRPRILCDYFVTEHAAGSPGYRWRNSSRAVLRTPRHAGRHRDRYRQAPRNDRQRDRALEWWAHAHRRSDHGDSRRRYGRGVATCGIDDQRSARPQERGDVTAGARVGPMGLLSSQRNQERHRHERLLRVCRRWPPTAGFSARPIRAVLAEQASIQSEARKLEAERDARTAEADQLLARHHRYAFAVALLQVAIALGAVAALTKQRLALVASGIAGLGGIVLALMATFGH